jgi:ABC-2 type transport system ATP-binding protein
VTVFLTTHYLEEAERLCDRIALLVRGQIVALDTVDGLRAQIGGTTVVEVTLGGEPGGPETRHIAVEDVAGAVRAALAQAEAEGRHVVAVNTLRPTLEDVFVQLTGLNADVMRAEKGGKGK